MSPVRLVKDIRLSQKFLSFSNEMTDAQHLLFYIILLNYVRSILFHQGHDYKRNILLAQSNRLNFWLIQNKLLENFLFPLRRYHFDCYWLVVYRPHASRTTLDDPRFMETFNRRRATPTASSPASNLIIVQSNGGAYGQRCKVARRSLNSFSDIDHAILFPSNSNESEKKLSSSWRESMREMTEKVENDYEAEAEGFILTSSYSCNELLLLHVGESRVVSERKMVDR